jgi:hypothetical protein
MEKQILELLKKNCYPLGELDDDEQAAKEIDKLTHDHYMRFMEWLSAKELTYKSLSKKYYFDADNGYYEITVEELYHYWLANIEKK